MRPLVKIQFLDLMFKKINGIFAQQNISTEFKIVTKIDNNFIISDYVNLNEFNELIEPYIDKEGNLIANKIQVNNYLKKIMNLTSESIETSKENLYEIANNPSALLVKLNSILENNKKLYFEHLATNSKLFPREMYNVKILGNDTILPFYKLHSEIDIQIISIINEKSILI